MCFVLIDKQGLVHFDRAEVGTDSEISELVELEALELRILRRNRDKAVQCRISAPPYLLRVETTDGTVLSTQQP